MKKELGMLVIGILTNISAQGLLVSISTVLSERPSSERVKLYFFGIKAVLWLKGDSLYVICN